jgi:hypothetical protein
LPVFSGQAQQQYEKQNIIGLLVKSQYNNLLYLYNNRDEADAPALEAIKKNFDNCKTLSCWKYVEVDDYTYKFLNDDVKNMILYNNSVYKNK